MASCARECCLSVASRQWQVVQGNATCQRQVVQVFQAKADASQWQVAQGKASRPSQGKSSKSKQVVQVKVDACRWSCPRHGCLSVGKVSKSRQVVQLVQLAQ